MVNRLICVLHVDDVEEEFIIVRELLSRLEGITFDIQWASDTKTALQMIRSQGTFDICLVDYYLGPDIGLDFVRTVMADGLMIPFILMSGQQDQAVHHEALHLGVRQCLDKNEITTSLLLRTLQSAMRN